MILHDLDQVRAEKALLGLNDPMVIDQWEPIRPCAGCFGCWVKTPGACVIRDAYGNMGELLGKTERLIIISRCVYGGFSPFVKNVLDRSISYLHPDFVIRGGEMHHRARYENTLGMTLFFYGPITKRERETALSLAKANAVNLGGRVEKVLFGSLEELEQGKWTEEIACAGSR